MVAFAGTGVTVRRSTICSSSVVATTSMHDRHRAWGVMVKLHIRSSRIGTAVHQNRYVYVFVTANSALPASWPDDGAVRQNHADARSGVPNVVDRRLIVGRSEISDG
jgi:hypothetical protein